MGTSESLTSCLEAFLSAGFLHSSQRTDQLRNSGMRVVVRTEEMRGVIDTDCGGPPM